MFPWVAISAPPNFIIQWQTSQQCVGGSYSSANQCLVPQGSRRGRYSARIGCTVFSFNRSQVLLAKNVWFQPTPLFQHPVVYLTSRNLTQLQGGEPRHLFTHRLVPRCRIIPPERISRLWLWVPQFLYFLYNRCPLKKHIHSYFHIFIYLTN